MAAPILPAPASKMVLDRPASGRAMVCGFAAELILCARARVGPGWSGFPLLHSCMGHVREDVSGVAELTPVLAYRTWRRRAPCVPAFPPTPRIGTRENTARRHRAPSPAMPRTAGPMLRRRR